MRRQRVVTNRADTSYDLYCIPLLMCSSLNIKKTITYDFENPGTDMGQAKQCGGVKRHMIYEPSSPDNSKPGCSMS